jgi:hypothetical protein
MTVNEQVALTAERQCVLVATDQFITGFLQIARQEVAM